MPEYAFLLGFIAILVVIALAFLGESVANVLETTAERLDTMIF